MLGTKVKLYCEANGKVYEDEVDSLNIIVQDDMIKGVSSPYIKTWNVAGLTKPTESQLNSYSSAATTYNKNEVIRATRRTAYGDIGEQLDEIYKDIDAWKARIKKIKDDNPKE